MLLWLDFENQQNDWFDLVKNLVLFKYLKQALETYQP